jgi:hypothetical protein
VLTVELKLKYIAFLFFVLVLHSSKAQSVEWISKDSTFHIQPYMQVQLWGVSTFNMKVDLDEDGVPEPVDNRFNPFFRRARLGFNANAYDHLKFKVVTFFDGLGADMLGADVGSAFGSFPGIGIWDAYFSWDLMPATDWFHLTGGYFRPQFGRESITSGFATTSGEKGTQQTYIRNHLVGQGSGRASGINLGGLIFPENSLVSINYNVGLFHTNTTGSGQIAATLSSGILWSPLLTARAVINVGDPELNTYDIAYVSNYYNERKGISIGFSSSTQGQTDLFTSSSALGLDFLFNWEAVNIDADWSFMNRTLAEETGIPPVNYSSNTGHIRASYNFVLPNRKIIEPVVMWDQFNGRNPASEPAEQVGAFSGSTDNWNIGCNYYLDTHKLKIIAHYIIQEGTPGNNVYTRQAGYRIERGDYFLLGLNAVF